MAKGIPQFHGYRLTQAREARGLSQVNLAALLQVSPSTISQYENDATKPTTESHDALIKALNLPKSFFFRAPIELKPTRFFYRSVSAATKSARNRAEKRFEWLRDIVIFFESHFDLPDVNIPKLDLPSSFHQITMEMIEDYAKQCRQHWGLREGPVPNLVRLLEKNGFVVSRTRLDAETLDAFSESDSTSRPFIVLGADKMSSVRSRFDAAHELAHIVLHKGVEQKNLLSSKEHAQLEQQAHRFASAFLLPESEFTQNLVAPTLEGFRALKEMWRVSIAAMIKRCSDLELITDSQATNLFINAGRRGWRKVEPLDDELPLELPKLLRQCVDMMTESNYKSRPQIAEEIGDPVADIEELAGLPEGYLSEGFGEVISVQFKSSNQEKPPTPDAGEIIPFRFIG